MKKMLKIILCMLPIIFTVTVFAGEARLDTIDISAVILNNGDMQVTENLSFDISGSLNGVYRDILLSTGDKYGASGIDVTLVEVNGKVYTYAPLEVALGTDGMYNLNSISGGKQVKIFTPSSNEVKNVKITYVLHDVVLKYNDVAELHWDFIGSGWDSEISSTNIVITTPEVSNDLRGWGHGPLNGVVEVKDGNTVILSATNVSANTEVTARVAMDTALFENVKKTYNTVALESILKEEEKYASEANTRRSLAKVGVYLLVADAVLVVICPIMWYTKKKKEFEVSDFVGKYYRELPEDYGPAVMTEVLGTKGYAKIMPATIMNLARKKHIKITEIKDSKGKTKDYELELVDKAELEQDETLMENEKYFALNMLFDKETKFTLKEFEKRFNRSSERDAAIAKSATWQKKIEEDAKARGVIKGNVSPFKGCWRVFLLPLLMTVITVAFGMLCAFEDVYSFGLFIFFIYIIIDSVVLIAISLKLKYTKKGITHKDMWEAFSKFLNDFSKMQDYPVQSLVLWEHYLVYAVALGKAEKVISQLQVMYPNELAETNTNLYANYAVMGFCRDSHAFSSFDKTFSHATTVAFATSSSGAGAGGGFSGGGGSGGGGGGGGGF